jgi:hypothetical protein
MSLFIFLALHHLALLSYASLKCFNHPPPEMLKHSPTYHHHPYIYRWILGW